MKVISWYLWKLCFLFMPSLKKIRARRYLNGLRRHWKPTFHYDWDSEDLREVGLGSLPVAWSRECPGSDVLSHDKASDTIGFAGVRHDGSVLITRLTRRSDRVAEVWVYLRLPSGEEFQLPHHPETHVCNTDGRSFAAAGLTFEILVPLRSWRVCFNGFLRRGVKRHPDKTDTEIVEVKFNFLWKSLYCFMVFPEDFHVDSMVTLLAKRPEGFCPPSELFSDKWYEQFGELHGIICVGDNLESELFLRGLKIRKEGTLDWEKVKCKLSIQGILRNGTAVHLFADAVDDTDIFVYGYIMLPSSVQLRQITKCDLEMDSWLKSDSCPSTLLLNLRSVENDEMFKMEINVNDSGCDLFGGANWNGKISLHKIDILLNNKPGEGILEFTRSQAVRKPVPSGISIRFLQEIDSNSFVHQIVAFSDKQCQSSQLVGGKAASLALMSMVAGKENDFEVPTGVCISTVALDNHFKENPQLEARLTDLHSVAWRRIDGNLQEECERMVLMMQNTQLSGSLMNDLKKSLHQVFSDSFENTKFAVRSSAVGEDGEETSAAGQNETFLGVTGFAEICSAVVKCWGSQFSFRSIEYKRQNGQLLNGGMGVIIQQMVSAETAGVLFSRHPITHSMAKMVITANYGLGESVVSASVDPDTVILKRTWNDQLTVEQIQIGEKAKMIVMADENQTMEVEVDPHNRKRSAVSNALAVRLGKIAIFLEQSFGSSRDIEWASRDNDIYLLQCRPVTTANMMTEFEVIHEFDTGMRTDKEFLTKANIGEVMPGAITPLTMSSTLFFQVIQLKKLMSWRINQYKYDPTQLDPYVLFYGHAFSDRVQGKALIRSEKKNAMLKATDIGFYGRVVDDHDVFQMAEERYAHFKTGGSKYSHITPSPRWYLGCASADDVFSGGMLSPNSLLKKAHKQFGGYSIPTDGTTTSEDLYNKITSYIPEYIEVAWPFISVTIASTIWNGIILTLLSQDSDDFTSEHYVDFATLIGACNGAESGDVPFSMRELAGTICKEIDPNEFCEMPCKDALLWMHQNENAAGKLFKLFLERHGHRGLKELDLGCITWDIDQEKLVSALQKMVKNPPPNDSSASSSINEVISSLNIPLGAFKKRLLAWVLKKSRNGVCYRERAKSLLIQFVHGFRKAYRRLADLMVKDGVLPDSSLIFYLTLEEIEILLKQRSAKVLRRAKQRCRLYCSMEKLQFPEMIVGYPVPINEEREKEEMEGVTHIKGAGAVEVILGMLCLMTLDNTWGGGLKSYPVSPGVVEGKARVVVDFNDVGTIQAGEILIARGTDIGWSPYFPMLSGVITELGGLVSHGAVVAREYGLPCVVGAQNATIYFQSGDNIRLDATTGIISKLH